jgi:hypothetical protein
LFAQQNGNAEKSKNDSLYFLDIDQKNEKIGSNFKKQLKSLENFEVGGYYRFMSNYRSMNNSYSNIAANKNNLFIGDDSQIPQLSLNLKGYANAHSSFGSDLFLWTPLTGSQLDYAKGLLKSIYIRTERTLENYIRATISVLMDNLHAMLTDRLPQDVQWYETIENALKDYYRDRITKEYKSMEK